MWGNGETYNQSDLGRKYWDQQGQGDDRGHERVTAGMEWQTQKYTMCKVGFAHPAKVYLGIASLKGLEWVVAWWLCVTNHLTLSHPLTVWSWHWSTIECPSGGVWTCTNIEQSWDQAPVWFSWVRSWRRSYHAGYIQDPTEMCFEIIFFKQ